MSQLHRQLGLLQGTALNMSNMVGIGPFITIPLIIAATNGPQCLLGWIVGALIAAGDGLVWAELSTAIPRSGGSYAYLREVFPHPWGRWISFLFIWQFILSGPLEIASGNIGFTMYVGYLWEGMSTWESKFVAVSVGIISIFLLYRKITFIGKTTVVLWIGMLGTVLFIIISGLMNFNASLIFPFPKDAFRLSPEFFKGMGMAMLIAMYDFLGYYDICYLGEEVKDPARVLPRAILISVAAVATIYFVMNISIIGVIPWQEAMESKFIVADFMQKLYGPGVATVVTLLILWTAFASIYALLLGYSRIPYAAARDGNFFAPFARLHRTKDFPHVSLLVLGCVAICASLVDISVVISALMTTRILIQFIGQIVGVFFLRKSYPPEARPFKMWLFPVPALLALVGWSYIFLTSGWQYILAGIGTVALGCVALGLKARRQKTGA